MPPGMPIFDGYVRGTATLHSQALSYQANNTRIYKLFKSIGPEGGECEPSWWTGPFFRPNGTIDGEEVVYDFYNLQRSKFTYHGALTVALTLGSIEVDAYEGFTRGFNLADSISAYEGFSLSFGVSKEVLSFVGTGGGLAIPVDRYGNIIEGVSVFTGSYGIGVGLSASTFVSAIPEVTFAISYYQEVQASRKDYKRRNNGDRSLAYAEMYKDLLSEVEMAGMYFAAATLKAWADRVQ